MAVNTGSVSISSQMLPILKSENYDSWSLKMKTFFMSNELWTLVESGFNEDEERLTAAQRTELKENRKKDSKALFYIQTAIDEDIFPKIMGATRSKIAWEILKEEFKGTDKMIIVRLQTLRREFESLLMKNSETIHEFSTRVSLIVNQARSLGENMSEQLIVEKILRSLPPKFDHVVAAIEESKDLSQLSFNCLIGSLKAHEQRLNTRVEVITEQVLQMKMNEKESNKGVSDERSFRPGRVFGRGGNPRGRFRGRGRGRNSGRGFSRQQVQDFQQNSGNKFQTPFKCHNCGRYGHLKAFCWNRTSNQAHYLENKTEKDEETSSEALFLTCLSSIDHYEEIWFLDSGCSNHMTGNKSLFVNLDESIKSEVKMGDDRYVKVFGKGTVTVKLKSENKVIHDVVFVPSLAQNLISLGQLVNKRFYAV